MDKRIYVKSPTAPEIVLIRASDGFAWDETNTVMEAFDNASWADYIVTATQIGGSKLWYFDFDALSGTLPAAVYVGMIYYATGSAYTDEPDLIVDFAWTSEELVTGLRLNQLFGGVEATIEAGSTVTTLAITTPTNVESEHLLNALAVHMQPGARQSWTRITSATGVTVNWTVTVYPELATAPNTGEKLWIGPLYQ